MTKLIALLAVLTSVAWGITATASWIAKKKAPRAIAAGRTPALPTTAEQDKAMLGAQLRTIAAIIFALVMFVALFRVSIGLSGQAGTAIALTAGLSASGGLLLYSALPARKQTASRQPLVAGRAFILPAASLLAFLSFLATTALAPAFAEIHLDGVPLAVVAALFSGATALAVHRLSTTLSLPDPRMAALDRSWRQLATRNLLQFAAGVLLAGLGGTAIMAGMELLKATGSTAAAHPGPDWAIAITAGGAGAAVTGVVLLILAAKGTLTMRATARDRDAAPITA
ncbi:hypothetical protein AAGW05_01105 [Arthrobacter sp. LAPM80]|uniref:hypothetical protein n=1 Tax=Arthrobacter sp. LAPM80 TaxID=3141788 RepID=UPI00398B42BF